MTWDQRPFFTNRRDKGEMHFPGMADKQVQATPSFQSEVRHQFLFSMTQEEIKLKVRGGRRWDRVGYSSPSDHVVEASARWAENILSLNARYQIVALSRVPISAKIWISAKQLSTVDEFHLIHSLSRGTDMREQQLSIGVPSSVNFPQIKNT